MRASPGTTATLSALLAIFLAGCGGPHPVPEHGTVTDATHTAAWVQWMPGATTCSGQPPVCTTSAGYPIFWPEEWRLEITDMDNPDWVGTVGVDREVFEICQIHAVWPQCGRAPGTAEGARMTEDPRLTSAERFDKLCAGNPQLGMSGFLRDLPRFMWATSAAEREPWVDEVVAGFIRQYIVKTCLLLDLRKDQIATTFTLSAEDIDRYAAEPFQYSDIGADKDPGGTVSRLLAENFGSHAEVGAAVDTCRRYDAERLGTSRRDR